MPFTVVVYYRGGLAHYSVLGRDGVFQIHLQRYDGKERLAPPPHIILVRGELNWSGNIHEPDLIKDLGNLIDKKLNNVIAGSGQPGMSKRQEQ